MAQDKPTTTDEMQDLLAHLLEGAAGKTAAHWKKLIGPVSALPIVLHPRSNWRITPKGKPVEIDAIEKAAAVVREAHHMSLRRERMTRYKAQSPLQDSNLEGETVLPTLLNDFEIACEPRVGRVVRPESDQDAIHARD